MNNKLKTYSSLVLSMIFWAFSFLWFKIANKTFQPITIVFLRLLFSVVLLTLYLVLAKGFMKIRKGDFKLFFFWHYSNHSSIFLVKALDLLMFPLQYVR
ncbi:MAG: EamA family transporter [Bacteroidales bacterium]|nr:EamA family transporter [Bacteroidales bacterium]